MKFKQIIIPLLALSTLVGCGENNPTPKPIPTPPEEPEEEIVILKTDPIREGGGYGESFLDMGLRYFSDNTEYLFVFNSSLTKDPSFRVTSSRPESGVVRLIDDQISKFYIDTKKPGDTIIQIWNSEDMLVFRDVLQVRKKYESADIVEALYEVDLFKSDDTLSAWYGKWRMTFIDTSPCRAILVGGDDYELDATFTFDITFWEYQPYRNAYLYHIVNVDTESRTTLYGLLIGETVDVIYVYYYMDGYDSLLCPLRVVTKE